MYISNFVPRGPKWLIGRIIKILGPVSFKVQLEDNVIIKRHQDQMRKCYSVKNEFSQSDQIIENDSCVEDSVTESYDDYIIKISNASTDLNMTLTTLNNDKGLSTPQVL